MNISQGVLIGLNLFTSPFRVSLSRDRLAVIPDFYLNKSRYSWNTKIPYRDCTLTSFPVLCPHPHGGFHRVLQHGSRYRRPCTGKKKPGWRAGQQQAEREGFEPPVPAKVRLISNQVHSTTLPPLRVGCRLLVIGCWRQCI